MKADPHGVLTGTHFIDGDHACCEGALAAGARFAAGYPITPVNRDRRALRCARADCWRNIHSDGRRTRCVDRFARRCVGRCQGFHGDVGPWLLADDGAHWIRSDDRNAVRVRRCAARRSIHRIADASRTSRHDAGALGLAWRLRNHRAVPELAAGMFRSDHQSLQSGRRIPRAGDVHDGRSRRPHDGKSRDPACGPDRSCSPQTHAQID